jgi:hypothetical protein
MPPIKRRAPSPQRDSFICRECQQIDFQKVLDLDVATLSRRKGGIFIADLGLRCHQPPTNNCSLCRLFHEFRLLAAWHRKLELRAYSFLDSTHSINMSACRKAGKEIISKDLPYLCVYPSEPWNKKGGDPYGDYRNGHPASDFDPTDLEDEIQAKGSLFCFKSGESQEPIVVPRAVSPYVDFAVIQQWLHHCTSSHKSVCKDIKTRITNFKVISCSSLEIEAAPESSLYAALSYVRGHPDARSRETSPIASSSTGKSGKEFPRTIRDAITVCKELGIPFLWVDKYCIDQESPEEMLEQINQMDAIYQNAHITIIGTGDDAHAGLPGVNHTERKCFAPAKIGNIKVFPCMPHPHLKIPASTWASRGWTFQEQYLSGRRLVFAEDQVYFECKTMNWQESPELDLDLTHSIRRQKSLSLIQSGIFDGEEPDEYNLGEARKTDPNANLWKYMTLVKHYSSRSLTNESDAMRAFAGITKSFEKSKSPVLQIWGVPFLPAHQTQHPAGYDMKSICVGLFWTHREMRWSDTKHSFVYNSIHRRPGFPSWSWVGWNGEIEWEIAVPMRSYMESFIPAVESMSLEIKSRPSINFRDLSHKSPSEIAECANPTALFIDGWIIPCSSLVNEGKHSYPPKMSSFGVLEAL